MTPDEYVESIIGKYAVMTGPYSKAEQSANSVAPSIRSWANRYLTTLNFSGSYAKRTAISIATDIDLLISLSSSTPGTLGEIYESLHSWTVKQGWSPKRQNVSIGISYNGARLDLVPGRLQAGYQNYHSLYTYKRRSWTQTNVSLHIRTVSGSNRTKELRAIKVWRTLHNLDFPSFYLELFVIDALKNKPSNQLAANVLHGLNTIANSLPVSRIVDPANTNNIVSDDLTAAEKFTISTQARASASKPNWGQIIW
jgi:hypothetical protein